MKRIYLYILIVTLFSACTSKGDSYKSLYLVKPEIEEIKEK